MAPRARRRGKAHAEDDRAPDAATNGVAAAPAHTPSPKGGDALAAVAAAKILSRRPSVIARRRFSEAVIWWIDMLGTVLFAASGCLSAGEANLDFIGCLVVGAVCGVGGGTIRDVLFIDRSIEGPAVFWVREPIYLEVAILSAIAAFCAHSAVAESVGELYASYAWSNAIFWLDSIGLGTCACGGVDDGVKRGLRFLPTLVVAGLSSIGGGIVANVLCQVPVRVMRADRELYAPAPILAAIIYYALYDRVPIGRRTLIAVAACVALRYYAVATGLRTPTLI